MFKLKQNRTHKLKYLRQANQSDLMLSDEADF